MHLPIIDMFAIPIALFSISQLVPSYSSLPSRALPITAVSDLLLLLVLSCVLTAHYPLCTIIMSCLIYHPWPSTSARSLSFILRLLRSFLSAMVIKACQRPGKLLHIIALWLFFLFRCRTADSAWGRPWWDLSKVCVFRFILLSIYWEMQQVYSSWQQKTREGEERKDCCEFGWGSLKNLRFWG